MLERRRVVGRDFELGKKEQVVALNKGGARQVHLPCKERFEVLKEGLRPEGF